MSNQEGSAAKQSFGCNLCNSVFETREQLKDHVWEYHEMDGDITTPIDERQGD
ncbi:hypothetical protein ACFQJA_03240 [Halobium salinum]